MQAPVPLDSFNVTYLMECHPHSPTSNSVVDYGLIYLEEEKYIIGFLDALPTMKCGGSLGKRRLYYSENTTSGCFSGCIVN